MHSVEVAGARKAGWCDPGGRVVGLRTNLVEMRQTALMLQEPCQQTLELGQYSSWSPARPFVPNNVLTMTQATAAQL